ncbi:hypothetical protein ACIQMY_20800 [Streptomyces sp. NPDC091368]|uniref:hypothetical protein n=1 Tax=Streptomyces sp. NPDC091368 TaxID=3365993 RepID=UPI003810B4EA
MATPTQQTELRSVYVTCRLGKSELNRLFSLAPEGIPAASVEISSQRDSTRYRAGTLTDLVNHVGSSNASGNLNVWDNLQLDAADASGDRKVTLKIDTERTEVQVSGTDATWVHGQAARVQLFLRGTGGRFRQKPRTAWLIKLLQFLIAMLTPLALLSLYAWSRVYVPGVSERTRLVGLAICLALYGFLLIGQWFARRANRAVLQPTADIPQGSWWSRATATDRIGLGSLTVAFLALIVATLTLGKDLAK